uniref:Uncharacterized protein n=1 Tax=Anguilla anguilla TaxID=7936 RepID=A0A0E9T1T7_ANGAN
MFPVISKLNLHLNCDLKLSKNSQAQNINAIIYFLVMLTTSVLQICC